MDAIISHDEMCRREGLNLRQGMHFGRDGKDSVILMSARPDAPYRDRVEDGGATLIYEGHDRPRAASLPDPKLADQPLEHAGGGLTQNGKFHLAAQETKLGRRAPGRVRVYEKIRPGIWSDNGVFLLVDSWDERDEFRAVWKFQLVAEGEGRRLIPSPVKLAVWARDRGKCSACGATGGLHFDRPPPPTAGDGGPLTAAEVRLVCAGHGGSKAGPLAR